MAELNLGWIPRHHARARVALAGLFRSLRALGVVCAIAHGDCVEDYDAACVLNFFLVTSDDQKAKLVSSWLSKMAQRYERDVGKALSFTVVSLDELSDYSPSEFNEILDTGIYIMGDIDKGLITRNLKQKYVYVTYDASYLPVRERLKLRDELFGKEVVFLYGPMPRKARIEGLVDKVGGLRVGEKAFIVPKDKAKVLMDELDKRGVRYFSREIELSLADIRHLKSRST